MAQKDERVKIMNEILSGIKVIIILHSFCLTPYQQGSFLHEHARPLNKRCTWRLTTGFAFIKMARLKAIIAIILLVGLGECARDLTKCVVYKNSNIVSQEVQ